jgi:hypothetical protein
MEICIANFHLANFHLANWTRPLRNSIILGRLAQLSHSPTILERLDSIFLILRIRNRISDHKANQEDISHILAKRLILMRGHTMHLPVTLEPHRVRMVFRTSRETVDTILVKCRGTQSISLFPDIQRRPFPLDRAPVTIAARMISRALATRIV